MNKQKEELLELLEKAKRSDLAVDLEDYDDDKTDEWIKDHAYDLYAVPGYVGNSAPIDMDEVQARRYFSDEDLNLDQKSYDAYMAKQKKLKDITAKKEQLADQYKKRTEYPINEKLADDYAIKAFSEGNNPKAVMNEIAGKTAMATDFIPGPLGLIGPNIRTVQKLTSDEPVLTKGTAADYALGTLGFAKEIPGVRTAATKVGKKIFGDGGKAITEEATKSAGIKKTLKDLAGMKVGMFPNAEGNYRLYIQPSMAFAKYEANDKLNDVTLPEEKDFNKAVSYVKKKWKDDWDKEYNIPDQNSSYLKLKAYEEYLKEKEEE